MCEFDRLFVEPIWNCKLTSNEFVCVRCRQTNTMLLATHSNLLTPNLSYTRESSHVRLENCLSICECRQCFTKLNAIKVVCFYVYRPLFLARLFVWASAAELTSSICNCAVYSQLNWPIYYPALQNRPMPRNTIWLIPNHRLTQRRCLYVSGIRCTQRYLLPIASRQPDINPSEQYNGVSFRIRYTLSRHRKMTARSMHKARTSNGVPVSTIALPSEYKICRLQYLYRFYEQHCPGPEEIYS